MMHNSLLSEVPSVVSVGASSFRKMIQAQPTVVLDLPWSPRLGGDDLMYRRLFGFAGTEEKVRKMEEGNQRVVAAMRDADPVAIDVRSAGEVIPGLESHMLLHAGPPITYQHMTDPMQGAAAGAVLFEGWAATLEEATDMLESGTIKFDSCHHHDAVGPMTGIISVSMPVFIVENRNGGHRSYSTINEGIGSVMRFGANGPDVIRRLKWFRDEFGPYLGAALRASGGIPLKSIIAKALVMGDEMHQRNTAASLLFFQAILPHFLAANSGKDLEASINFLAETEQFFLNLAMCVGKIMGDAGQGVGAGCIVTAMCRNGYEFAVRVSGLGNRWWTSPVNTPKGMYFAGFSEKDANPDIGDSAILETIGLGGLAMPASPAVVGFVGAGTFDRAVELFREFDGIVMANNAGWTIPELNGAPAHIGIDIRFVAATGIEPLINTGMAHKEAGRGQIGAGTVTAPLACFESACKELAHVLSDEIY